MVNGTCDSGLLLTAALVLGVVLCALGRVYLRLVSSDDQPERMRFLIPAAAGREVGQALLAAAAETERRAVAGEEDA